MFYIIIFTLCLLFTFDMQMKVKATDELIFSGGTTKPVTDELFTDESMPKATNDFIFSDGTLEGEPVTDKPPRCINPNGRVGVCIDLRACEPLTYVLRKRLVERYEFVRKCQCSVSGDVGKTPKVCCTRDTRFIDNNEDYRERVVFPYDSKQSKTTTPTINIITSTTTTTDAAPATIDLDNDSEPDNRAKSEFPIDCGQRNMLEGRIIGGEAALLNEFSWIAALEYRNSRGTLDISCGGSLINARYVVTAAHCVRGEIERKVGKLESVRLGDYNLDTEDDCNADDCIPRYQRNYVERIIVYPKYIGMKNDKTHPREEHDIALIRLRDIVEFTEFLQPICLPSPNDDETRPFQVGMSLTAAGWGHTGNSRRSAILKKVNLPLIDREICRESYAQYLVPADGQFCAGGNFGEDSCRGDSGGPLMAINSNYKWVLEGLVSFGKSCGLETPAIYTRVRSYATWIHENVVDSYKV